MSRSPEDQKVADRLFDALRDDLLKRDLSNTESYDKAILTLSSASLGFSLTAIKFIVPVESAVYFWLLISGWTLLVISVILSLAAYLTSNKAILVQLDNARDYYKHGVEDAFTRKNHFNSINKFLNHATGALLALAITFIVVFISINLNTGKPTMTKDKSTSTYIEKSANVPTMESVSSASDSSTHSANIPSMEQAPSSSSSSQSSSSSEGEK